MFILLLNVNDAKLVRCIPFPLEKKGDWNWKTARLALMAGNTGLGTIRRESTLKNECKGAPFSSKHMNQDIFTKSMVILLKDQEMNNSFVYWYLSFCMNEDF